MITKMNIQDAVFRLQYVLDTIPAKLHAIPKQRFSAKESPDKWSRQQIIGHLIDSAANNHQRFIRAQYEATPKIVYDQNNWNTLNFYETADSALVINLWFSYNQHLLFVIKQIPDENLERLCDVGNNQQVTLAFLIVDYVDHLEHHLKYVFSS